MSADARFMPFRQYVKLAANEFRRIMGKNPVPWVPQSAAEKEADSYARAVYRHKIARLRLKQEGHITEI